MARLCRAAHIGSSPIPAPSYRPSSLDTTRAPRQGRSVWEAKGRAFAKLCIIFFAKWLRMHRLTICADAVPRAKSPNLLPVRHNRRSFVASDSTPSCILRRHVSRRHQQAGLLRPSSALSALGTDGISDCRQDASSMQGRQRLVCTRAYTWFCASHTFAPWGRALSSCLIRPCVAILCKPAPQYRGVSEVTLMAIQRPRP